ncbi:DUF5696 domain-containing protein [Paenibacillus sp. NPDC056579]|uniref:DUF5696 domain-containing protein n=1 Tax=Paenibacillus sp. NPDC056579 TaxID=3345871 RepID=UPI0036B7A6DB
MRRKRHKIVLSATLAAALSISLIATQTVQTINAADPPAAGSAKTDNAAQPAANTQAHAQAPAQAPAQQAAQPVDINKVKAELPSDANFKLAAQSDKLKLLVDSTTGHFQVEDKRNGEIWRSYPNPDQWPQETITGTWRNNLRSPIMLEYIDAANFKSQPKMTSLLEDKGAVEGLQTTATGFKLTFNFKTSGFKIPVEVNVKDDYIETKIIDSGITEGKLSLLNLKLYPMFGAEPSIGQDGYMVVPDGSGALIRFKQKSINDKSIYRENMYGSDISFYAERTARLNATFPVYGMKSGDKAFVAVLTGGEEYSKVFGSPSGAFGISNWMTSEWQYRIKFFQNTSRKGNAGFFTYSKERFTSEARSTRYYLLEKDKADYVGMASKYREYLMKDQGLQQLKVTSNKIPMFLDIVGADIKKGMLWDKYLTGTTTSEAMEMVKRLYGLGIENMSVNYLGWQKGGYSSFGGLFPVDKRLGGNEGMKQFIQYAHTLNVPVFLGGNYTYNNNERDGFNPRYDGMRNLAGRLQEFEQFSNLEKITLMSPEFSAQSLSKDLKEFKELGADGVHFEDGIGRFLNSDFNTRYPSTRTETMRTQQDMLKEAKETLGNVSVERANAYTLKNISHIHRFNDDFSYDLFIDEAIPFYQIAIHGLVTYSSNWANLRNQYKTEMLRSIEYGASPSFIFTNAPSEEMKGAYSVYYYSMNVHDWESTAVEEYQRYNKALGDVQNKFITGHRTIAPNVKEVTYEGGKKVIINYNTTAYSDGKISVPAQDIAVVAGGGSQ